MWLRSRRHSVHRRRRQVSPWPSFGAIRTKGLTEHLRNSRRDMTRGCTRTRATCGWSLSRALISTRMMRSKSVWGREISSEYRVATNIGAVGTKRKAHCFIRKGRGNSTSYQRSSTHHRSVTSCSCQNHFQLELRSQRGEDRLRDRSLTDL